MSDKGNTDKLVERQLTGVVIGGFYDVYNDLGFGFLESVYRRGMYYELTARGLYVEEEYTIDVRYKQWKAGHFRADLLVERKLIVEIKSTRTLGPEDFRQPINYLRSTGIQVGMLLHFGPKARHYRYVCTTSSQDPSERLIHVHESSDQER